MSDSVSDIISFNLDRLIFRREMQEDEYLGKDGLIYCGKCHTPVQCRVTLWGKEKTVPCICRCRQEELELRKQREKEQEKQRHIRRLKVNGIQEKNLLEWRFDAAEDNKDIQMAKRYVENWKQVRADNLGLLLWGNVGTGKSFAAACIANALLEKGTPVHVGGDDRRKVIGREKQDIVKEVLGL